MRPAENMHTLNQHDLESIKRDHSVKTVAERAGVKLLRSGAEWKGLCPFHQERSPSFTIYEDGERWHCFGCSKDGDVIDFVRQWRGCDLRDAVAFLAPAPLPVRHTIIAAPAEKHAVFLKTGQAIVATFEFFDAVGELAYRKHRIEPAANGRDKEFRYDRPDGKGAWIAGQGEARAPYRLPDLLSEPAGLLYMAEGEAKADKLASWGLLATSLKDWRVDFSPFVAGRRVIVLPDNDDTGENLASRTVAMLEQAGARPTILRLPDLPAKGDILDWHGTPDELQQLAASLLDVTAEWPQPVNLWARFQEPPLPTGLLPELIEQFAVRQGAIMGADPAGLAMAALTVCAAAIPDSISVQVKRNDPTWRENARLWTALVGPPSRKKTPIFKAALAPIRSIDNALMQSYMKQQQEVDALPPAERKAAPRPKQRRLIISDATIEAAQEVLRDSPDGVLSEQDELSGWFGSMDKFTPGKGSQADRAFWLKAFNGGTYNLNRIARGASQIPNLSISLLGGIQPEPIRKLAADTVDDGLVQRLIPVILRPSEVGMDVPADGVVTAYDALVRKLHLMQPMVHLGHGQSNRAMPVQFGYGAKEIRERLEREHLELVEALETTSPKLASHYGKYDGLFARLCLLWHCIEHPDEGVPRMEIGKETAERVAQFMVDFIRPSAVAFYAGLLGMSAGHEDLVALASLIVAKGLDEVRARDAQSSTQSFRSMTADQFRVLCEKLEAFSWLERREPGPKSSTPRWVVNPRVHQAFADRAKREQERRLAAKKALRDALGG